jgi:Family of unknown function (DUF5927)/Core-2/I-Branching enzyme
MSIGFIMLCHTALDRAAQVARHWAEAGCPVVIHVDAPVPTAQVKRLRDDLADLHNVRFCARHRCEWGTFGIVAATQSAAELMLAEFPRVDHVFLASGACLPLRPVPELIDYLAARRDTDFIESVTTADVGWTIGGLDLERFTLRFPFSWRKQRRFFDLYVRLQRRLGLRRRIPNGLQPHLGSQWWCLTRRTLQAILQSPNRAQHDAYFKHVWIPDESYFQTLVRQVSDRVESRSLTLAKFDFQGKPHIFYDDHLQLLRRSDCFVARKAWPHANRLYTAFLDPDALAQSPVEPNPAKIDRLFAKAVERRVKGRPGLYMQSRFPIEHHENGLTAAPYSVFQGFADVFENFEPWLTKATGARVHGHLFAPERAEFAEHATVFDGALSDSATLRDYNPTSFLTNLVWNARGERQCFQFGPRDNQAISECLARDPNATIMIVTGAWAVPLFRSNREASDLRPLMARLQKVEIEHLALLQKPWVKARVRTWSLADFAENPGDPLQTLLDEISPRNPRRLTEMPVMVDLTGFGQFLQRLRNQGMQPVVMGDFPVETETAAAPQRGSRPYVVK